MDSVLKNHQFNGSPQRRENILNNLQERLTEVSYEVKKVILNVLENWLNNHALLSPSTWAKQRVSEYEDYEEYEQECLEHGFDSMIQKLEIPI